MKSPGDDEQATRFESGLELRVCSSRLPGRDPFLVPRWGRQHLGEDP